MDENSNEIGNKSTTLELSRIPPSPTEPSDSGSIILSDHNSVSLYVIYLFIP